MSEADQDLQDPSTELEGEERSTTMPVVGVGACAVSLRSLETLFAGIGPDLGAAYLIAVRQLEGLDVSTVLDVLRRASPLPVSIGADGERMEPNHAYISGPDDMIGITDGHLHVRPASEPIGHRGSIDSMLISLAKHAHDRAVAVILGGLGSDGTAGVTATKKLGGLSIGEAETEDDENSGQGFTGPFGAVDLHVRLEEIPAQIALYLRNLLSVATLPERAPVAEQVEAQVAQIVTVLRNVTGHDFHGYKRGTFLRRVHRRLQVLQIDDIDAYIARLRGDRSEAQDFFQDLLIGVTQFFRDPSEFAVLEGEIPRLFEGKGPGDQFRVWVLGCATGEEAYSIARLLKEHLATIDQPPQVQIFATDLDPRALGLARAGQYAESIAGHIRPDRLVRWFSREGDTHCVSKELREMCIFSPHNVIEAIKPHPMRLERARFEALDRMLSEEISDAARVRPSKERCKGAYRVPTRNQRANVPEGTPTSVDPDPLDPPAPDNMAAELATANAQLAATRVEVARLRDALDAAATREQRLTHELQRRVRNMLAVIRSIFRRTRENGASQEEFAEHFQERLDAIARYQADIVGLESGGLELEDMVRDELLQVDCRDGPNCRIAGPSVRLRTKSAALIGLALHELTTNAVKFGALYHGGSLSVEWTLTGLSPAATLRLRWKETGLPLVSAAPRPRGFGQDFIEEGLPYELGATTAFELKPGGLDCSIILALPAGTEPSQTYLDVSGDAAPFLSSDAERPR